MKNKINKKGPIAWMAGNSVASNLVMLILILGGIMMLFQIKQEIFPEFALDYVVVTVPYKGASPEEVEKGVLLSIEESVRGIDGVDEVRSRAMSNAGNVFIKTLHKADLNKVKQDVQQAVDRITSFPEDAEEPNVTTIVSKKQAISLIVYGDYDKKTIRHYAEKIRNDLLSNSHLQEKPKPPPKNLSFLGKAKFFIQRKIANFSKPKGEIEQVELFNSEPLEISIEISQKNLRKYNLTIADVAKKLDNASIELPGGGVKTQKGEVLFRMKDRKEYGVDFAKTAIKTLSNGTELLLEDIAIIKDGFEEVDAFATYNGHPAVLMNVFRIGNQTPTQVANLVKMYIKKYNKTLPKGLMVANWGDKSELYQGRINLLLKNGYIGLIVVFILLALFLEIRLAFWVTLGIPISFLGTFLFLPAMDTSLNMISLFAFIIALGIVVDDAIVVGENIYDNHKKGLSFKDSAILATHEVSHPVIFSILTNIVAFLPLYFVPGFLGKIFRVIPIVVIIIFLISLIECLFVLPAHVASQKENFQKKLFPPFSWLYNMQQRFSDWFSNLIHQVYGPFVRLTLKYKYVTIAGGLTIFILTVGYIMSGRLGLSMFPKIESDRAVVIVKLPYGAPFEKTRNVEKILVNAAKEIAKENGGDKLVRGIFSFIGGNGGDPQQFASSLNASGGSHIIRIDVRLTSEETRTILASEFTKIWREKTAHIIGLDSIIFKSDAGGPGAEVAISIGANHKHLDTLREVSSKITDALSKYSNVSDIEDGFPEGNEQIDFILLPSGKSLGLTSSDVARQIRNSFYGAEVARHQRERNEVKTMVRLPKSERISEYNIENLIIRTPIGKEVLLGEITKITRGRSYTVINRNNGKRRVTVTADVTPRKSAFQILGDLQKTLYPKLLKEYPGLSFTVEGKQKDMRENIESLKYSFPIAMLIIFALLAIPFKSYIQPVIIMISVPFGIVGAVIGHIIMGYSLSMMSMFGVVALSGVVVNDSLVLIEFANKQRDNGVDIFTAISSAGIRRFRPIMLTTLSTAGGLAPMILETSFQAKFMIPMAISLGFGILFATLITLILVPSLYLIIENFKKKKGNYYG